MKSNGVITEEITAPFTRHSKHFFSEDVQRWISMFEKTRYFEGAEGSRVVRPLKIDLLLWRTSLCPMDIQAEINKTARIQDDEIT